MYDDVVKKYPDSLAIYNETNNPADVPISTVQKWFIAPKGGQVPMFMQYNGIMIGEDVMSFWKIGNDRDNLHKVYKFHLPFGWRKETNG